MLPYGLKITWFCLSLSGLVSCCVVLIAFGRAVSNHWVPFLYCSGCAVLQLAFCIGLVWQMNPLLMPRAFCLAQTFIIGFAAFFLTGVCTAFSLATNFTVLKPKTWSQGTGRALMWRNVYAGPMILFPLAASTAQITVSLKLNAIQPSDDLHCDASHPMWVRFLGYAGLPLLLALPCLFLTILSIYRVSKVQRHINRSFTEENGSPLTSLPRRRSRNSLFSPKPSPSPSRSPISPGRAPIRPGFSSPVLSARQFHLPFSPPPLDPHPDYFGSSARSSTLDEPDSPASSSFPTFSCGDSQVTGRREPIDPGGIMNPEAMMPYEFHDHTRVEDWTSKTDSPDTDKVSSVRWANHHEDTEDEMGQSKSDFGSDYYKGGGEAEDEEGDEGFVVIGDEYRYPHLPHRTHDRISHILKRAPNLAPAIWRLILFQLLFTLVLLLASISTIIDVASRASNPTPFGTQHVALLLAAWGPAIFFAHLPAVRQHIYQMFSRTSK